jgi:hypothetical protein
MQGRASYRTLQRALGIRISEPRAVIVLAVILALATWAPLLALSAMQGLARPGTAAQPFLRDFTPHARFLFALPLLIVADIVVGPRFNKIGNFVAISGLLADNQIPKFRSTIRSAMKIRDSNLSELAIIALAYVSVAFTIQLQLRTSTSSWLAVDVNGTRHLSLAGWWYALLSLPAFHFLLYRWLFRLLIWARVMYGLSRLDLQLVPTHPDRVGGLGFIGQAMPATALIVLAISAVLCSAIATQVVLGEATMKQFAYSYGTFVAIITVAFAGPFLLFAPKLVEVKRRALMDYSALGIRWGRLFEKQWVAPAANDASISGTEISALAGFDRSYAVIRQMKPIPLDFADLRAIILAALLPLIPFVGSQIPLENALKLLKVLAL